MDHRFAKAARIGDGLIWFFLALVPLYLLAGRLPLPTCRELDFPALGLGLSLLLRYRLKNALPLDQLGWHRLWQGVRQRPQILVWLATAGYAAGLAFVSLLQHSRFLTSWDLGVFSQALWNTWRGDILWSSLRGISLLRDHFHPMLFLLTPLYALLPWPQFLLILQSLALALGAPAVFRLAIRSGCGRLTAAGLALLYLCHPALRGANLFDFHVIVLACPLWLWHLALREECPRIAWALALLALACGEASWMVLGGLGCFDLLRGRWRLGLGELCLGLGGLLLVIKVIMPWLGGGQQYLYVDRYSYLGGGMFEMLKTLLTRPGLVLQHLWVPGKIHYLMGLAGGVMLLPLLRPLSWPLFLPLLAGIMLSDYQPQWSFDFHYSALLLAPLFYSAALGLKTLGGIWERLGIGRAWLFLGLVMVALLSLKATPMNRAWTLLASPVPQAHQALAQVPPLAAVAAQECLTPHLANRPRLYELPSVPPQTEFVVLCAQLRPGRFLTAGKLLELRRDLVSQRGAAPIWQKGGCEVLRLPQKPE